MSHLHEQQDDSEQLDGEPESWERCANCDLMFWPSESDAMHSASYCSAECEADEGEDA